MGMLQVIRSEASNLTKAEKYILCGSACLVGTYLLNRVLSILESTMEHEYTADLHVGSFSFSLNKQ